MTTKTTTTTRDKYGFIVRPNYVGTPGPEFKEYTQRIQKKINEFGRKKKLIQVLKDILKKFKQKYLI